mmetsp:Transcript_3820/g.11042  ORF Transcript_3820/g.11042 Transcript_3820/m.11042 type:complete len:218 (-) Transcript_3820:7-660(-)
MPRLEEKERRRWSRKHSGSAMAALTKSSRVRPSMYPTSRSSSPRCGKTMVSRESAITTMYPTRQRKTEAQVSALQKAWAHRPYDPGMFPRRLPRLKAWCLSQALTRIMVVDAFSAITAMVRPVPTSRDEPAVAQGRLRMPVPRPAVMRFIVIEVHEALGAGEAATSFRTSSAMGWYAASSGRPSMARVVPAARGRRRGPGNSARLRGLGAFFDSSRT